MGVDLDCRPGDTLALFEEVMVVVALIMKACFALVLGNGPNTPSR